MSTTHYSPSASAADTERYIRGKEDERGIAITYDVPGGPGAVSYTHLTLPTILLV